MLGIIIGISSVIILVGMGQGTQKTVSDQIEKLGTNLITISITGNRTLL
jgi:putative ABC transport system permease protein